jgi:2-polyprenyl-3-methyl-5-hydroxy-6-metoxy-1,4-benzoquinol methylase
MSLENLDQYVGAYHGDFPFADENLGMLRAYASYFIDSVGVRANSDVLSLGIGYQIVSQSIVRELGSRLASYTIVEGSRAVITEFTSQWPLERKPEVFEAYFESFEPTRKFDAIEMGFVLEHVDDPALVVRRFRQFLKPDGFIGMAVPNARSLHRLIGHEAGLLDDVYKLSAEDLQLGHKRYFDLDSFRHLAESEGLVVRRARGIMMKPVTTSQLGSLNLSPEVEQALYKVADRLPAISNAMYIEAATS